MIKYLVCSEYDALALEVFGLIRKLSTSRRSVEVDPKWDRGDMTITPARLKYCHRGGDELIEFGMVSAPVPHPGAVNVSLIVDPKEIALVASYSNAVAVRGVCCPHREMAVHIGEKIIGFENSAIFAVRNPNLARIASQIIDSLLVCADTIGREQSERRSNKLARTRAGIERFVLKRAEVRKSRMAELSF